MYINDDFACQNIVNICFYDVRNRPFCCCSQNNITRFIHGGCVTVHINIGLQDNVALQFSYFCLTNLTTLLFSVHYT